MYVTQKTVLYFIFYYYKKLSMFVQHVYIFDDGCGSVDHPTFLFNEIRFLYKL